MQNNIIINKKDHGCDRIFHTVKNSHPVTSFIFFPKETKFQSLSGKLTIFFILICLIFSLQKIFQLQNSKSYTVAVSVVPTPAILIKLALIFIVMPAMVPNHTTDPKQGECQ